MPIQFAYYGLILLLVGICAMKIARFQPNAGEAAHGRIVALFIVVLVSAAVRWAFDLEGIVGGVVYVLEAAAAGLGWFALIGYMAAMQREPEAGNAG